VDQDGNDVLVHEQDIGDEESDEHNHSHEESEESESVEKTNCHFHAGVE
jgi:zinc transporter 1/2/3